MSSDGIRIESLEFLHGGQAVLSGLSMHVPHGNHTLITGASGSGKSTLLRLIAGLESPAAGIIGIDGTLASDARRVVLAPHKRGVSMVFQDLALWPNLTAMQNVRLGLAGSGLTRSQELARATECLDMCGLAELRDRIPGRLSGGQQQRVALARALAVRPGFLLLDEPFTGLDRPLRRRLAADLVGLLASCKTTVIAVSHDPDDFAAVCGRTVVLDAGRVSDQAAADPNPGAS